MQEKSFLEALLYPREKLIKYLSTGQNTKITAASLLYSYLIERVKVINSAEDLQHFRDHIEDLSGWLDGMDSMLYAARNDAENIHDPRHPIEYPTAALPEAKTSMFGMFGTMAQSVARKIRPSANEPLNVEFNTVELVGDDSWDHISTPRASSKCEAPPKQLEIPHLSAAYQKMIYDNDNHEPNSFKPKPLEADASGSLCM